MKISVIIPVYNTEKYLKECVESVLAQTYHNLEILLINDGATDLSPQICESYAKQDARIKLIHKENGGLSDTRNTGIKQCSGDYVLFLDSDDYWDDPKMVEKLVDQMQQYPVDILNSLIVVPQARIQKIYGRYQTICIMLKICRRRQTAGKRSDFRTSDQ